jgi:CDP-diacylglycerol--glycerol-3-phosphate 3-phosphatidyltransferase
MIALIIFIMLLDWVDGYVARKKGTASDFGALFDIVGDRIIENVLWIYLAVVQLVPFWVPMVILTRGSMTDVLRSMVLITEGKTPFGEKTMMSSRWTRALVSSRVSRGTYNSLKIATFCYMAAILTLKSAISEFSLPIQMSGTILAIGSIMVYITVGTCIVRGLPVIWDGRRYFSPI